jgi:transcription factor MYB, plant
MPCSSPPPPLRLRVGSAAADQASSSSSSKGGGPVLTAGTTTMDTGATAAGGVGNGNAGHHQQESSSSGQSRLAPRGHWRPAEDARLRELVGLYGPQNWNLIAEKLDGRSGTFHPSVPCWVCSSDYNESKRALIYIYIYV